MVSFDHGLFMVIDPSESQGGQWVARLLIFFCLYGLTINGRFLVIARKCLASLVVASVNQFPYDKQFSI